ncbi:MAG: type II toxin-antitoxin system RelE/ParE family toxin [Alphaproteobacteria bacterium]
MAGTYLASLEQRFEQLAVEPALGRPVPHFRPGYFRNMFLRHAIFYTRNADGVLIVRVLHQRMDFGRHLSDE